MRRHVGAETLAGFRQGDLSPRRSSRIRAHLAGCARCSDLNSDLAGVTTLLAAAEPPPIPEHLAARIQTALATEAARRVAQTAEATAGNGGTEPAGADAPTALPHDARSPRHERPGRAWPRRHGLSSPLALRAAAAAAAAVVIAGGAYGVAQLAGGSSSTSSSPAAAASGAAGGARSAGPLVGTPSAGSGLPYMYNGRQETITPVTTSVDFTPANLRSEVTSELSRHGAARAARPNAAVPAETAPASGSVLAGCVNRIAAGQLVLLVDIGHYQGAPATVIVTSAPGGGAEVVWVVGTGCSASRGDVLTRVRLAPRG